MKKLITYGALAMLLLVSFSGCKKCKKCHTEMLGVKSPAVEYCGDDLERAQKTPGMICDE